MIARSHIPLHPLNLFVESIFYYFGFNPVHSMDRFLPDGNVQVIFDLRDTPKYIYDNDTLEELQACKKVWFSGFRTEPITIPSGRESEMLIITFRKGKVFPFLNEPIQNLTNYVVDAELVLSNVILDLRDKLTETPSIDDKFLLVEKDLMKHYLERLSVNPFVDFMISRICAEPDQSSMREIAAKVGYSQKHIIKIFREHVGVTPKEFLKVIRFQKTIEEIEAYRMPSWASVAIDCGFYDQSHFIADFKKYSGFTPKEYLAKRGDQLNYIPIP